MQAGCNMMLPLLNPVVCHGVSHCGVLCHAAAGLFVVQVLKAPSQSALMQVLSSWMR